MTARLAKALRCEGLSAILLVIALLAAAPVIHGLADMPWTALWLCLIATAAAALAFSVHLLLDAMLFNLAASFPDETAGCRAVDEFLARAGLRAASAAPRLLSDRVAGTKRLILRHRITVAIFVALFAIFVAGGL
jgi:hypothetical protein